METLRLFVSCSVSSILLFQKFISLSSYMYGLCYNRGVIRNGAAVIFQRKNRYPFYESRLREESG